MRRLAAAAAAALVLAAPAGAVDWPRFGGDAQLTNDVPTTRPGVIAAAVAPRLERRWTAALDGAIVASPLYADGVVVGGSARGVVYAATMAGSVYAVSALGGTVLWQRQLGTVDTGCEQEEPGVASTFGVVSTGVIDRARNRLYVIGATGLVYALDLSTGETAPGWPVRIVADTGAEVVWGGLTLAGNRLYVPVASYCDQPGADGSLANGRLVAVDVDAAAIAATFDVVPGAGDFGGIWGFGGASVDPLSGHLWTATGNSWVYDPGCGCIVETAGYAESVVELDPDLHVVASSRPQGIPSVEGDTDFGSTPLLFQPPGCPRLAAAQSKSGFLYVWRRDALGAGPIWSAFIGPADLDHPFVGEPSWSPELDMLYVADARGYDAQGAIVHFDAVDAFAVGPGCSFPDTPTWTTPDIGAGPKAPPLVSGDVLFVVGAEVPALYALDAATGALLWSTSFPGSVFAPPAFAGDEVVAGDTSGDLAAFGIGYGPLARHFAPP
ncbi:MAG TPA: PQQ-binding-like beta-propeller repeat protein [Gaiellaceae bacterium]|nr:PQQ-binding-like beta-propeller repeat protein [Gaiellaceae bacterium]